MNTKKKDITTCKIPIAFQSYESIFVDFDFRDLDKRSINEDLNTWINNYLLKLPYKLKFVNIELIINLPNEIKNLEKEKLVSEGIKNSYKSFFYLQKKLSFMGIRRIVYYVVSSLILLSAWYFIQNEKGTSIFTSLLSAGGTVLLWEVMSLILIESKNFKYKVRINKKLCNMKIVFNYK